MCKRYVCVCVCLPITKRMWKKLLHVLYIFKDILCVQVFPYMYVHHVQVWCPNRPE